MQLLNHPAARLMRLHQPVGIWLLLWPCLWSLTLASHGKPSIILLILFTLGAIIMRSAGCIINDMADRDLDKHVERTRTRPLASGEMTMVQAFFILAGLLTAAFIIAVILGRHVFFWALLSLPLVAAYPFMKRISWWPQAFLGLTFNWGALMGWIAVRGQLELPALLLYAGGIFWTLGYDTIYAHQDKKDDARIGIKSTALHLGDQTRHVVAGFYILASLLWASAGLASANGIGYLAGLTLTMLHFAYQLWKVDLDNPLSCRRIFVSNVQAGGLLFLATLLCNT